MDAHDRAHSMEEIRDHWLKNRSADGSDWEQALGAVYDLALVGERRRQIELLGGLRKEFMWAFLSGEPRWIADQILAAKLAELRAEEG